LLLLSAGATAGAGLLWDNRNLPDGSGFRALSPPSFAAIRAAEDVVVSAPGWIITRYAYNVIEDLEWQHSGTTELLIYADAGGQPGKLLGAFQAPHIRTASGKSYFGRPHYYYDVPGLDIRLGPGVYWIGPRDPFGSGSGSNYWSSSDGGRDGGCPPEHPGGTCRRAQFSLNEGRTWGEDLYHRGFEIHGGVVLEPSTFFGTAAALLACVRRWRSRGGHR